MAIIDGDALGNLLMGDIDGILADDIIRGRGGDDTLFGFDGDDQLFGGTGSDGIGGGAGDDTLAGNDGDDVLAGGRGADRLVGGAGVDTASYVGSLGGVAVDLSAGTASGGEAEGDRLSGIENVVGSAFDDLLTGDDGANVLAGGGGVDVLRGGHGDDTIDGGEGADEIDGGGDSDTVSYAAAGEGIGVNLLLNSGGGGDTLVAVENVTGSDFADFLYADDLDNRLDGGGGGDRLRGLVGDDTLSGGEGADVLSGGSGGDVLAGGSGADVLNGDAGRDLASYARSGSGVAVSLNVADGAGEGGDAEGDRLFNVEDLVGSAFGDVLAGSAGANVIEGGEGADFIIGDSGNDTFLFRALHDDADSIADFGTVAGNNDRLQFDGDAFGDLPTGPLDAGRFVANADGVATAAAHRFVYDTDDGVLLFDANGSAAGGVTAIVGLAGAPRLTAADFDIL